jgi:hypothetical protein
MSRWPWSRRRNGNASSLLDILRAPVGSQLVLGLRRAVSTAYYNVVLGEGRWNGGREILLSTDAKDRRFLCVLPPKVSPATIREALEFARGTMSIGDQVVILPLPIDDERLRSKPELWEVMSVGLVQGRGGL